MDERTLRSNPDKTSMVSPLPNNKRGSRARTRSSDEPEPGEQLPEKTDNQLLTPETEMILQLLQQIQANTDAGLFALKEDMNLQLTSRLAQMNATVESLAQRFEPSESQRTREQNRVTTWRTSQPAQQVDGKTTATLEGVSPIMATHKQSYSLLRIAIDKQIEEIKPYCGKKMENVESWIKKIDNLAEIAGIPDDETFTLAKLKLQGDAEKWWDNKRKEITSWTALKNKLIDTFGPISKSSKLELEAFLHRRQQNLHEPATKYWNDMMSHCTAYDDKMSTEDRVWRIVNGALPEFRGKNENKTFKDEDQLLKALIQNEENRLRGTYEGSEREAQISMVDRGSRSAQETVAYGRQQPRDVTNPQARVQQRPPPDSWQTRRSYDGNGRWNPSHPN